MHDAGCAHVFYKNLMGGIAALHIGADHRKPVLLPFSAGAKARARSQEIAQHRFPGPMSGSRPPVA
ncbi:hypothetical protein [Paracoccus sp. NSM]|uniref:hypothetical protein n=1 Tax=Paracoccus sp. NSM TaxID=3457784 RepID=UPI0040357C92